MSKPKAPAAPDYTAAAQATAAGNLEAAKYATQANRINQYTPYGSLTYDVSKDPSGQDKWAQYLNLTPQGQSLLDQQEKTSAGLASLQDAATQRVAQVQNNPFPYQGIQDVQDSAYQGLTSRLDPQWKQNEDDIRTRLANQGIVMGSQAYDNAMRGFNQSKNDAYQQANLAAIDKAPQALQLANALRSIPLNELNAIRTSSQVTNPTFNAVPQQATTAGADYLGAANANYGSQLDAFNAKQASNAGLMKGLFGIGSAIAGNPAFF